MKIVKRKTQKAIRKSLKKVIKKHGSKIAAGLAGGIASALATLASTEAPRGKGAKSNLSALSQMLSDKLTSNGGESRSRTGVRKKSGKKKGKGARARNPEAEQSEREV